MYFYTFFEIIYLFQILKNIYLKFYKLCYYMHISHNLLNKMFFLNSEL